VQLLFIGLSGFQTLWGDFDKSPLSPVFAHSTSFLPPACPEFQQLLQDAATACGKDPKPWPWPIRR